MTEPTTIEAMHRASRPASSGGACLVVVDGTAHGVHELEPSRPLGIGRSRGSGIRVDDAAVSRLHATLEWDGEASVRVTDHGSRNGTFVREARVEGSTVARSGDAITVGPARFVLLVSHGAEAPRSATLMSRALSLADRAAACSLPVLILGETGAGKEVLARRIHAASDRRAGPFVALNCGAIPEALAESQLFGHEKGAFTGATERRAGVFEAASGGTLFLDEIGELHLVQQVRLLRVLEAHEIVRVGATRPTPVDVRIVAATHRDLDRAAREGRFRDDLLYRLDVLRIVVPPLRERRDELPALVAGLLAELGVTTPIEPAALALLAAEPFPGNVRELRNVLARAIALGTGALDRSAIEAALPHETHGREASGVLRGQVADAEREAIQAALAATNGNQTHAARRLGISRRTLLYKMQRHGLGRAKSTG